MPVLWKWAHKEISWNYAKIFYIWLRADGHKDILLRMSRHLEKKYLNVENTLEKHSSGMYKPFFYV